MSSEDIDLLILVFKYLEMVIYHQIQYLDSTTVTEMYKLTKKLTAEYDESHGIEHHVMVFVNAIKILIDLRLSNIYNKELYDKLDVLVVYTSLLHDTVDPKYPNGLEEKIRTVQIFLQKKCHTESENIEWIINNMSFSKEAKNGYPTHPDPVVQMARDIVSDADKLEAIGTIGIQRCRQYTEMHYPDAAPEKIKELVVQHCHDKLLRLKDFYIRTDPGKKMALSGHNDIQKYIDQQ